MYSGKNQDYYIEGYAKITYLYCIAGEVFPSVLKGLLWGHYSRRKGAWNSFGVNKKIKKIIFFETGERLYRGKNV